VRGAASNDRPYCDNNPLINIRREVLSKMKLPVGRQSFRNSQNGIESELEKCLGLFSPT
jgi:hypothetical protein